MSKEDIIKRHLSKKTLSVLKEGISFPIKPSDLMDHMTGVFDDVIPDMMTSMMSDLRSEGHLSPCPNNGPRNVKAMSAWNIFVEKGEITADDDWWVEVYLKRSRAFDIPRMHLIRATASIKPRDALVTEEKFDAAIKSALTDIRSAYLTEDTYSELDARQTCGLSGEALSTGRDPLNPVIFEFSMKEYKYHEAPVIEEPKTVQHMILDLPSEKLVMADWFRIKGFNDGLEAIIGEDYYDLNSAHGLDQRMSDYLTKAGLAIVQVGNTSPYAYEDGAGIWRMGHVNDEHDRFWNKDDTPTEHKAPDPKWTTCTDLWANIFADPERIIDILMASGEYDDRESARKSLDDYLSETYGAHEIDMQGVTRLHVYAPTGYAVNREAFDRDFKAGEIDTLLMTWKNMILMSWKFSLKMMSCQRTRKSSNTRRCHAST